jgi:hypothetical protein
VAKRPTPAAKALTVRERVLLFCTGSDTDWQRAGFADETVTALAVRGLVIKGRPRTARTDG